MGLSGFTGADNTRTEGAFVGPVSSGCVGDCGAFTITTFTAVQSFGPTSWVSILPLTNTLCGNTGCIWHYLH